MAADIPTIAAAAGTLTGATLAANVLASSLTSVGILASPHLTSPVVDSGGVVVTAGTLSFGDTASRIVPGATSLSLRNTANSADNLILTDAGAATFRSGQTVTATTFSGALSGNATTATTLATARAINGVNFDGSAAITVTAAAGTLTGATLAAGVTASSLTSVGVLAAPHFTSAVVDSGGLTITSGGIAVTGASTITGTLAGVTTLTATTVVAALTGNATTATTLQTARTINTVSFDGSANITVTAAAGTLTGATLASGVLASSLTSVGVLASPHVTSPVVDSGGVVVTSGNLTFSAASDIVSASNTASAFRITDGTTAYHAIDTRNTVTGVVAHSLSASAPTIASASGVTYSVMSIPAVTTTLTGTTTVTALNGLALNIAAPTVTDASAVTVTTMSTVYIAGAPAQAGSVTGTNKYALHVAAGAVLFSSTVNVTSTLTGAGNIVTNGGAFQGANGGNCYLDASGATGTINFRTNNGGTTMATLAPSVLTMTDAYNIAVGSTTGTKIGTATTQKLGIFNATPVVQQTDGAALVNNATANGTTNQIDDFAGTLYSTDGPVIQRDIYQLAKKLKIVDDALRLYGWLS